MDGKIIRDDLMGVRNITIFDTLMMMMTPENDNLYRVLSTNNWQDLGNIFTEGRGPSEFLTAPSGYYEKQNGDVIMVTGHPITKEQREVNISKSLTEKTTVFTDNRLLDISHIENLGSIQPLGDGTFFADRLTSYKYTPLCGNMGF